MTTNDSNKLIKEILGGNTKLFEKVVDDHKNLVFSLALRLVKNREEAEEVSQDTFIKVFTSLKGFKGDSKLSTWIYRITYNTCLDYLKTNKKRLDFAEVDEISENEIDGVNNALDAFIIGERKTMIKSCIDDLAVEDAALLTCYYFEDKNLVELEKIMDLSVNTLKVRLFRARKRLAVLLNKKMQPEILRNHG